MKSLKHFRAHRLTNLRPLQVEALEPRHLLAAAPIITEFMTKNDGFLLDGNGDSPDWIELYNAGDQPVDLAGYRLTDDPSSANRWSFPSVTLDAGQYLVVFASSEAMPDAEGHLHTSFSLRVGGEYVALISPTGQTLSEFGLNGADYPPQQSNVSYGIAQSQPDQLPVKVGYMTRPTPGTANVDNSQILDGLVLDTAFSIDRGIFERPITVEITSATPGAVIRFTTDGSTPSAEHGETYTAPLILGRTTTLRAMATHDNMVPTNVDTQTYLFLDDVLTQDGEGLPMTWGTFVFGSSEAPQGDPVPANYEMDPEVVNDERYRATIKDDLKSLPIVSIVMNPDDLWNSESGLYSNTTRQGVEWERPVSVELFNADGTTEFQIDAGVRIHGGFGRRPSASAKHSFRLFFRNQYGAPKLEYPWFGEDQVDQFDTIVLRANYNYSWSRGDRGGSQTGADYTMITDRWAAVAQEEMGGLATQGEFVHLYVNGLYWGVYNPNERPDASFQAAHRGGEKEDYDVMNHEGLVSGDRQAWRDLLNLVRQRPLDMQAVEEMLDLDNYIDYMILNQLGGNNDWPQNNWYASRMRAEGERWQFHVWDSEFFFIDKNHNRVSSLPGEGPGAIYTRLRLDPEFQIRYADRIYRHFFHDGVLTPDANIERLNKLAAVVDRAVVGESARWGDAWMNQVSPARTRDDDWMPRLDELRNEYFPQRHEIILEQFRRGRLWTSVAAPVLSQHGGGIAADFMLTLQHDLPEAAIYYTLDGADPRALGGQVNPSATLNSDAPVFVLPGTRVQARARVDDEWSPLVDVSFQTLGDFNEDGSLDAADVDELCRAIHERASEARFDLNADGAINRADQAQLVNDLLETTAGDANLDQVFNSTDLIAVFKAGEYEDLILGNSGWATGDWNCDGDFSTADLVAAFQAGRYSFASQEARDFAPPP